MAITSKDIISLSHARAKLTELCEEVRAKGNEKIITKNGGSCVALIDADRLDHYHRLERGAYSHRAVAGSNPGSR